MISVVGYDSYQTRSREDIELLGLIRLSLYDKEVEDRR